MFLGPNLLPPLSSAVFQISSGIRGRPAEKGSGSNRMEKVFSSKSRRSAKVQIEAAKGDRVKCLHKKVEIPVCIKSVFSYKRIHLGGVVFRNYFARALDVLYVETVLGECIFQHNFSDLILICKRKYYDNQT